jgi:hypothetical protein
MPTINELLEKHAGEIADESRRFKSEVQTEIPRDPLRRPWNDVANESEAVGGARSVANKAPTKSSTLTPEKATVWYATLGSILEAIKQNLKLLSLVFFLTFAASSIGAQFVPVTYSSALQLYAPDKSDDISSRLALYANRVEFASFPVGFKIPLGLIVRRLKGPEAKAWVIEQYLSKNKVSDKGFDADAVRVETYYAEGSELLVIQGYARTPETAVEITNLYWDYFENEIRNMRGEHLAKVSEWIQMTSFDLGQKSASLMERIAKLSPEKQGAEKVQIRGRLAESFADLQMKQMRVQRERDDLSAAVADRSGEKLFLLSDIEIQDMRRIKLALNEQKNGTSPERLNTQKEDLLKQAREFAHDRLAEKEIELSSLKEQLRKISPQLLSYKSTDTADSAASSQIRELLRQEDQYQSQLDELSKLKSQIEVESNLVHMRLRPIQAATPDTSTCRPYKMLLYGLGAVIALFFSLLTLGIAQQFRQVRQATVTE